MFEMGQGFACMSAPVKEMGRLIVEGKLRHGADPLLRWCARTSPRGSTRPGT